MRYQFVTRLSLYRQPAIRAVLNSEPGEQQPNEVVRFSHRGYGALSSAATGSLLDADCRRHSSNQIHIRASHLLDELPGIDVHRIQESSLAFRKKQVER